MGIFFDEENACTALDTSFKTDISPSACMAPILGSFFDHFGKGARGPFSPTLAVCDSGYGSSSKLVSAIAVTGVSFSLSIEFRSSLLISSSSCGASKFVMVLLEIYMGIHPLEEIIFD